MKALIVLLALLASFPSVAKEYPTQPVRLVVGFAAGGPTDIIGRIFAQKMTELLGTPMVVDNKPGAGGNVAAETVARAQPDGYTVLLTHLATQVISPLVYAKLPYDVDRDFEPVTQLIAVPNLMVVHPSVAASSVSELIALAKKSPGQLNFASGGSGTSGHLSSELFKALAGVDIVHVPYKGSAAALADLRTGRVQMMTENLQFLLPQVKSGALRALAVTPASRVSIVPELPTVAEAGVPGYDVSSWFGIVVPRGTPAAIIERLNREFVRAVRAPDMQQKFADMAAVPVGSTPAEFAMLIKREAVKWAPVVKATGLRVD
ncbi:MAG: Bug family tripartite tricarboxylate transporter substrate binding protein [Lautropia sp.]